MLGASYNLATAFLGRTPIDLKATDNIEDMGPGFYRITSVLPIGFPENAQPFGYLIVKGTGAYRQLYYSNTSHEIWTAHSYTGTASGKIAGWTKFDNFGCNTLAELKAALANV